MLIVAEDFPIFLYIFISKDTELFIIYRVLEVFLFNARALLF